MCAKTPRYLACLLAVSIGLALGGAEIGTASASTPTGSDPAALAVLHQVEGLYSKPSQSSRARMAMPAQPQAEGSTATRGTDGTPLMLALARALPRLSPTDRATAQRMLSAGTSTTNPCNPLVGQGLEGGSPSNDGTFVTDSTAHFDVSYTLTGDDAVTQDYANHVEDVLEHVYTTEITEMGFQPPLSPNTPNPYTDPSPRTPIALCDITTGYYGFCSPIVTLHGNAQPAACTLRNNYAGYLTPYDNGNADAPLDVTVAHEFFHAVQFRQNAFVDTDVPPLWLMEGTAVWMENQVYPAIHDYFQYLPATGIRNPSVPFNITVTSDDFAENPSALWPFTVYADFAFFKFLSGWLRDPGTVRQMWNYLGTHPNAAPMTALNAVLASHGRTRLRMLLNWGIWNTLPPGSYPARAAYAPVGWWQARKLDRSRRTFNSPVAKIRPFADAPIRINRGPRVRTGTKLRVVVNGPSYVGGGYYTYRIVKTNGVNFTITRQIGPRGSAFIIPFNGSVSYVVFTLNNTSANRTKRFTMSAAVI